MLSDIFILEKLVQLLILFSVRVQPESPELPLRRVWNERKMRYPFICRITID
jgi:hypothetical protein